MTIRDFSFIFTILSRIGFILPGIREIFTKYPFCGNTNRSAVWEVGVAPAVPLPLRFEHLQRHQRVLLSNFGSKDLSRPPEQRISVYISAVRWVLPLPSGFYPPLFRNHFAQMGVFWVLFRNQNKGVVKLTELHWYPQSWKCRVFMSYYVSYRIEVDTESRRICSFSAGFEAMSWLRLVFPNSETKPPDNYCFPARCAVIDFLLRVFFSLPRVLENQLFL